MLRQDARRIERGITEGKPRPCLGIACGVCPYHGVNKFVGGAVNSDQSNKSALAGEMVGVVANRLDAAAVAQVCDFRNDNFAEGWVLPEQSKQSLRGVYERQVAVLILDPLPHDPPSRAFDPIQNRTYCAVIQS